MTKIDKNFLQKKIDNFKKETWLLLNPIKLTITTFPLLSATIGLISYFLIVNPIGTKLFPGFFCGIQKGVEKLQSDLFNFVITLAKPLFNILLNNTGGIVLICFLFILIKSMIAIKNKRARERFPVLGVPNKDNVTIMLVLFKIRCIEIARLYAIVRGEQEQANDGNWIGKFLNDYYYYASYNPDHKQKKWRVELNKKIVTNLLKDTFNLQDYYYSVDNDVKASDLLIAVILQNEIYNPKPLYGIKVFGVLNKTISSLIKEYEKFNSHSSALFIESPLTLIFSKLKITSSYETIHKTWEDIIFALKSTLVFLRLQGDASFEIDKILKEIDALQSLQNHLALKYLLSQKNKALHSSIFAPPKEKEELIVSQLKNNQIRELFR